MRGGAIGEVSPDAWLGDAMQGRVDVEGRGSVLRVHEVWPDDILSGAVVLTGSSGRLSAPDLPPRAIAAHGATYQNLATCGDGACGLHAAFGSPQQGQMVCEADARVAVAAHMESYVVRVQHGTRVPS